MEENLSKYVEFDMLTCKYFGSLPSIGESRRYKTIAGALKWVERKINETKLRNENWGMPSLRNQSLGLNRR
jgi:hypothetical protein